MEVDKRQETGPVYLSANKLDTLQIPSLARFKNYFYLCIHQPGQANLFYSRTKQIAGF